MQKYFEWKDLFVKILLFGDGNELNLLMLYHIIFSGKYH